MARLLFGSENPPGTKYVAGSQDAIGLTYPGINHLHYSGNYWPDRIDSCLDDEICDWLEKSIAVIPLGERPAGYDPLLQQNLAQKIVGQLAITGKHCYDAIMSKDIRSFGKSLTATHDAWREMLPNTTTREIDDTLNSFNDKGYGRTTSGCGGGYIYLASQDDIPNSFRIKIRREKLAEII